MPSFQSSLQSVKMNASTHSCLPTLLATVIDSYLLHGSPLQNNTVCLVWDDFDFEPVFPEQGQLVILRSSEYEDLYEALEKTFCERFVVFGSIILPFLTSFMSAVLRVTWRSSGNHMVLVDNDFSDEILSHRIVKELPDILFVKIEDDCLFGAYTSRYESLYSEDPEELYLLDVFNETGFGEEVNLFPNKRENFNGRVIRLGMFDYPPFNKFFEDPDGNVAINKSGEMVKYFYEGLEGNILVSYCRRYNCSIEIVPCGYGEWGDIYSNFSGEGSLGLIVDRKVDIALNSMYLWQNVFLACGMSRTMSRSGITFLVPGPKIVGSWLLPVHPFSKELWIGVIVCCVIEAISIGLMRYKETPKSVPDRLSKSISFGAMSTYQIFCSQGLSDKLALTPMRVIFFSCLIIDLIVTSAYGGGLATILTLPTFSDVANTLLKMISLGLDWGAVSDAWIYSVANSDDVTILNLLKQYHLYTFDEISNLTSEGKVGVIFEKLTYGLFSTPEFITKESSKLYTVSLEELYYELCVAFVSKSWVHMKNFNKVISMIQESGLPKIWEWEMGVKYMDDVIQKNLESSMHPLENLSGDEPVPLGMSNFIGMMLIWLLGTGISIVAFLIERHFGKK